MFVNYVIGVWSTSYGLFFLERATDYFIMEIYSQMDKLLAVTVLEILALLLLVTSILLLFSPSSSHLYLMINEYFDT